MRMRLLSLPTCNGRLLRESYVHGKLHVGQNGGHYRGKQEALYLPNEVFFGKRQFQIDVYIPLVPLVPLVIRLLAPVGRSVSRTNRQTDRQTDTQNDYSNPRACTPRVNYTSFQNVRVSHQGDCIVPAHVILS